MFATEIDFGSSRIWVHFDHAHSQSVVSEGLPAVPFVFVDSAFTRLTEVREQSKQSNVRVMTIWARIAEGIEDECVLDQIEPGILTINVSSSQVHEMTTLLRENGFPVGDLAGLNFYVASFAAQRVPWATPVLTTFQTIDAESVN